MSTWPIYYTPESDSPVSIAEPGPVRSDGRLYCSAKCCNKAGRLTNATERAPQAEGTCAECGGWIGNPFARFEEEE